MTTMHRLLLPSVPQKQTEGKPRETLPNQGKEKAIIRELITSMGKDEKQASSGQITKRERLLSCKYYLRKYYLQMNHLTNIK